MAIIKMHDMITRARHEGDNGRRVPLLIALRPPQGLEATAYQRGIIGAARGRGTASGAAATTTAGAAAAAGAGLRATGATGGGAGIARRAACTTATSSALRVGSGASICSPRARRARISSSHAVRVH